MATANLWQLDFLATKPLADSELVYLGVKPLQVSRCYVRCRWHQGVCYLGIRGLHYVAITERENTM